MNLPRSFYVPGRRFFLSLFVVTCFILLFSPGQKPPAVYAYEEPVHEEFNEAAAHLVEHYDTNDKYEEVYLAAHITQLRRGATNEDRQYASYVPTNCNDGRFMRHFYQPGQAQGAGNGLPPPGWGARCTDAVTWARSSAGDPNAGAAGDLTWTGALDRYDYTDAAKEQAYLRVGHVAHLIGDMAQPDHVHVHPHPNQAYEPWATANFSPPSSGSMTIPTGINRMEDFLITMATITYHASTFQGGTLAENATTPISPASELAQMFNVRWVDHTWPADNTWELRNIGSTVLIGDWDNDYGRGYVQNEWWETIQETGGGLYPAGWYTLEGNVFGNAVPRFYKGAANTRALNQIYLTTLAPRAIERIAGMYQHFHDIANHPPYVYKVTVTQAGNCIYEKHWENQVSNNEVNSRTLEDECSTPEAERWVNAEDGAVQIKIEFGDNQGAIEEQVQNVEVRIAGQTISGQLDGDKKVWTGTFTPSSDGSMDGEQAIEILAKDTDNHFTARNFPGDQLDADPASPAKAGQAEPYNWQGYQTGPDRSHKIKIDTLSPDIRILYQTVGSNCEPSYQLRTEVTDRGSGAGRSTLKRVTATPAGGANPANDPHTGIIGTVGVGQSLEYRIEAEDKAGNISEKAANQPGPARPPGCDHSDDNYSAASPQAQTGTIISPNDEPVRVAVLSNGFAPDSSGFVNALKEPNILVEPDFSPDIVEEYPLLVIPTGGLYGLENSTFFRATLEEYANRGGTIIVFDQQHGSDYTALPGGGLDGYGWAEDNSCTLSSLYIRNYDQAISGFSEAILDSNVDGYFTNLPDDSDVLLYRARNGQPAMVRYNFGSGTVIATTAYDDWGVSNWQTTADAYILNRDLLAWAVDPALLAEYDPNAAFSVPVVLTNETGVTAASVRLSLLAPGKQIIREETQAISLTAGSAMSVTFSGTAARPLGIWRVDYTLLDGEGRVIQERQPGERFIVKDPHPLSAPVKELALNVNAPTEDFVSGSDGEFTFTVFNTSSVSRTLQVRYGLPHHTWETGQSAIYGNFSDLSRTVVVGPNSQEQFVHVFPMRTNDRLFAYLYEGSSLKDQTWFQTRKATAFATASVRAAQAEYGPGQTVNISATVTNLAGLNVNFTLELRVVAPNGTAVFSDTRPIPLSGGANRSEAFSFVLPNHIPDGTYRVRADVYQGTARVFGTFSGFALPNSPARFSLTLPGSLPATPADPLQVMVNNSHAYLPVAGTLGLVVTSPNGVTTTVAAQPYSLTHGQNGTLLFDLSTVPAAFGSYQFSFSSEDQYSERTWQQTGNIAFATQLHFDQRSYRVRDTLGFTVTLENNGGFGASPEVTVAIPDLAYEDVQVIPLAAGQESDIFFSVPIPADLAPEFHDVNVTIELGSSSSDSHRFYVPPSRVLGRLDILAYQTGESVVVDLNNIGGVDAPVTATLKLMDQYGVVLAESDADTTVPAGQSESVGLTIPDGAASGIYLLVVQGRNTETLAPINLQRNLTVSGVAASLMVDTGEPAYFSDDEIATFADILMTDGVMEDGELNLRICSANSDDGFTSPPPPRVNYTSTTVPFNWIDIASGGTRLDGGYDTYSLVDLGFSFDYYGNSYSQMYVNTNGYITFGDASYSPTSGAIPSLAAPNNAIYVLWDWLYPIGGDYGSIFVQQVSASRYVVQWQSVSHCCYIGTPETFQVILDGSDDSITLQYLDVTDTAYATVGVENSFGSAAVQIADDEEGVIYDNLAMKLAPAEVLVDEITYQSAAVSLQWVDIAAGGNVVAQTDNGYSQVDIGFPFQFYGITYTQMFVGSNGMISFEEGFYDWDNRVIPNGSAPNNAIYALWDDLYPTGGENGNIFMQQIDANHTVIQWQAVAHCCGDPQTFQVILDGTDHSVTLQYLDVGDTSGVTVGVENGNGTEAIVIAHNQPDVIVDGLALKLNAIQPIVPDVTYDSAATTYDWIDIASGGAIVARGGDSYSYVELGFPFEFYGVTYTGMYIDSNGYVSFDGSNSYPYNEGLPNNNYPNTSIYAFWDDLDASGGDSGLVYAEQTGPTRYVVQWQEVTHCCDYDRPETFQLILDGSDNSATLQYQTVSDASGATAGVENSNGSLYVQLSYDQTDVLTDSLAIKLTSDVQLVPQVVYDSTDVPIDWRNIAATGNIVADSDDTYSYVEIGFPFEFYGTTYTDMYVTSNGYLSFGEANTSYSTEYIPNYNQPNNSIYAFWTDLYPAGGIYGNVYTEQISPTMRVIQWEGVSHCCSTGSPETFQIILDGSDNTVTLQYLDVTDSSYALAGVENGTGTQATLIAYGDTSLLADGLAYKLTPGEELVEQATYISTTIPFAWEDIGPTPGTETLIGAYTYMQVDLGFGFPFYGITYTQMYVSSDGFVSFENGYSNPYNEAIPSSYEPNNAVYALWDYLFPIGGDYGQVYGRQTGPTEYVIQWEEVAHCCSTGSPETFEIVLDGSDGSITLQYEDVSYTDYATAGVENRSGTRATQIASNEPDILVDGSAFQLTPDTQYVQIDSYQPETITLDWQEVAPPADTHVLIGTDNYTQVELGFPFQFYGITYTQMVVTSNGFVGFEESDDDGGGEDPPPSDEIPGSILGAGGGGDGGFWNGSNVAIPDPQVPNNAIYALWDSLNPTGYTNGHVYARQTGPNQYVVQWEGVGHCCDGGGDLAPTSPETFQIVIDGTDHTIRLQYEDVSLTDGATVGVENKFASQATQLAFDQAGIIEDGDAFLLTPVPESVLRPSYVVSEEPIAWVEVGPAAGTEVIVGYNSYQEVDLGFGFRFYGDSYSSAFVGTNGYLTFGNGATSSFNSALPSYAAPNNAIYALWDSLYPTGGEAGQIYGRRTGPNEYVIQWEQVTHCCSNSNPESFQIVLNGVDNTITLAYEDVSFTSSATVGVENEFGTRATQLVYNQSGQIVDGMARKLTPVQEEVPPPPICDPTVPQPLELMIVIDRSGSMSGQPFIDAQAAAQSFVDFLDLSIDRVGLASFESSARLDVPLTQNGDAVKTAIGNLFASGGTAIGEGMAVAHNQLLANGTPGVAQVIVLLSDGVNGSGRDPLTAANAAKADGIKVVTIGLGFGVDEPLMRAMASSEDDYHFAPASGDLEEIYASIANSICRSPLPYDATCGGFVLWEGVFPVSADPSLNISELVEPLDVTGRMNLNGRLYAATGQPIAVDNEPFYLHDRDTAITLESDKTYYRPGATIQISGQVTNTSPLPINTDLRVWAGETLLIDEPLQLDSGEGMSYATTFSQTTGLATPNLTLVAAANDLFIYRVVIVEAPEVEAALDAPALAGRNPFQTTLTISNTGRVPASVEAAINGVVATDSYDLLPGAVVRIEGSLSIIEDTTVVAPVSGDLNETLTAPVIFGEAAELAFTPEATYPVGPVDVPYEIGNTGLLAVSFDTEVTLRDDEGDEVDSFTIPVDLPEAETLPGTLHFSNLAAGEYGLEYDSFFGSGVESFTVIALENASLDAEAAAIVGPTVPVTATVTNTGLAEFTGQVTLQTEFFQASAPVTGLEVGQSTEIPFLVNTAAAAAGQHPAHLELFNQTNGLLDTADVSLTVAVPDLMLTTLPTNLTLPVSTTVTMTFGVSNEGGAAGDGLLSFTFSDVVDEEQPVWLAAGENGTVDFTFFVQPDLEAKTYPAPYVFNGEPGVLLLTVEGIDIGVTPALDRAGYYEGETAVLTLHIEELADRFTPPLYALVRFNDYSEIQPFNLSPSGDVSLDFNVPVSFLGDEKVFYGIYDLASDRSIHLNTVYLPRLYPDVTVLTDKQVYLPGETVIATVVTTATGQLDAVAPGFDGLVPLPGSDTSFSFTLPLDIVRGTYSIDSIPLNCGCLNENQTLRTPFDVAAPEVRITDSYLDDSHYEPAETIRLDLVVAADQAVTARLLTWIERPDRSLATGPSQLVDLDASPANLLTSLFTLDTDQSGMHRVIYQLVHPANSSLLYGQGAEVFDVGSAVVTAVATDKVEYEADTEPVLATVTLFATVPVAGQLNLTVDGAAADSQAVSLVAGFQEVLVSLPGGYGIGDHELRATLVQGSLDSWRETDFEYATSGPDLIARPPSLVDSAGNAASIVAIIGNRGDQPAGPSVAALYDGDPTAGGVLITTFNVPALDSGASHEETVSWPVSGRAGSNLLVLVADSLSDVAETNETNNKASSTAEVAALKHNLSTNQASYYRSDTAQLTADLENLSTTAALTGLVLETNVYRLNGTTTEELLFSDSRPLANLAAGATRQETLSWAIASTVDDFDMTFLVQQQVVVAGVDQPVETVEAAVIPILVSFASDPELHDHFAVYPEAPSIELAASDTADIFYQLNEGTALSYAAPFELTDGQWLLAAYPERNGITVGPAIELPFSVDTLPPQTTISLNPPAPNGNNNWYISDVTASLSAVDAGVGVYQTQFSSNGVDWTAYITPTLTSTDEGILTVYYRSIDWASHVEPTQSVIVQIDETPPVLVHDGPYQIRAGETITLDGRTSTDALSGLFSTAWDSDNDGQYDDGDPVLFSWPGGTEPYPVSLMGTDAAGNVAIVNTTVSPGQPTAITIRDFRLELSQGTTLLLLLFMLFVGLVSWTVWSGSGRRRLRS